LTQNHISLFSENDAYLFSGNTQIRTMKLIDKFIYFNTSGIAKKAINKILTNKLKNKHLSEFSNEVWTEYSYRTEIVKKKETFGANIMVKLSLLTLIIYEKLLTNNNDKQTAIKLTSRINWIIYENLTHKFWFFTGFFSKRPIKRVKKAMNFFIKYFPYTSPGYEMKILKTENKIVAFNVTKCPAADFFQEHNLNELCIESWCNLDYPLAEKWNVKLERNKTIAKGNELCDFKFVE